MSAGFFLPTAWEQAQPLLEQQLQQLSAANPVGPVQAPYPPEDLIAQPGSFQVVLSWIPPQLGASVTGYRVYKGDENHLFQSINDPATTQCTIPLTGNTSVGLYVSCINAAGESQKVFILGKSTSEQYATSGGSSGNVPVAPPPPRACFSGDVEIITLRGVIRFADLLPTDSVLTAKGIWRPIEKIHVHIGWSGDVYFWPSGGVVTADETLFFEGTWRSASHCRLGPCIRWSNGTVYHVTVATDEPEELRFTPKTERSITLANGWRAHNIKIYPY